jgi:hypothetical protein
MPFGSLLIGEIMENCVNTVSQLLYDLDANVALCSGPKAAGQIKNRPLLWNKGEVVATCVSWQIEAVASNEVVTAVG